MRRAALLIALGGIAGAFAFSALASAQPLVVERSGAGSATAAERVDIEIAIDTTASMGPSIKQAQEDARRLVAGVRKYAPGARFAVVQFRDQRDTPEYEIVQPLTGNVGLILAALAKLSAGGGGDTPEAYNLVFRNSLDAGLGWASGSRKIVVVIGDAEPHGAATAGFDKCRDRSADPNGLNTATELGRMRSGGRTLLMVLQKATAATSIECYRQLAQAAYTGGAARKSGDNLIAVIQALIKKAVATGTGKYRFGFSAYGNPQRPFPGYVGPFQLGPVRISGSGWVTSTSGSGGIRLNLRANAGRYRSMSTTWGVVRLLSASTSGAQTTLRIQVRVVNHTIPQLCPPGTLGVLTLIDNPRRLKNGYSSDGVRTFFPSPARTAPDGGAACRTHVHGMNNTDVSWTDPPRGGAPSGGNWARVTINAVSSGTGGGGSGGGGAGKGPQTAKAALAVIKSIITKNASACGIRGWRLQVSGRPGNWTAVAELTLPSGKGTATWNIVGANVTASNQLAADVSAGCR